MNDAVKIAKMLWDLGAVSIRPRDPFTWASGLRSPLYCDNRLIISNVKARRQTTKAFQRMLDQLVWRPTFIAGAATAGIPHAAWLAEALGLPMIYVRASDKKHGKQNRIEGRLPELAKVVVIEDLISTGGSSIRVAEAVQEAGAHVIGIAAIFQYGMAKAAENFVQSGFDYATLSSLDAMLQVTEQEGLLNAEDRALVQAWRQDPQAWSDTHGD